MNKLNITTLRRILIIIVSFCSGFIQTYAGSSEKEITMMTYNIQGHAIINSRQVDKIASVIKGVAPRM